MDAFVSLSVSRPMDAAEVVARGISDPTEQMATRKAIMQGSGVSVVIFRSLVLRFHFRGLNRRGQPKTLDLPESEPGTARKQLGYVAIAATTSADACLLASDAPRSNRSVWPRRLNGSRPVGDPTSVEAKGHAHGKFNDC